MSKQTYRKTKMKNGKNISQLFKDVIDYVSPLQTPTEQAIYNYLLRWSVFEGKETVQIGERSLAKSVSKPAKGKLSKSKGLSYSTVRSTLRDLERKGHIKVNAIELKGKIIKVNTPYEINESREKMKKQGAKAKRIDYFKDPEGRRELFERDHWTCVYCGDRVTLKNATLDHYKPQNKGGGNNKENLKTCCLVCNSIKSGKTYEEASPFLLKSIKERRNKTNESNNHS